MSLTKRSDKQPDKYERIGGRTPRWWEAVTGNEYQWVERRDGKLCMCRHPAKKNRQPLHDRVAALGGKRGDCDKDGSTRSSGRPDDGSRGSGAERRQTSERDSSSSESRRISGANRGRQDNGMSPAAPAIAENLTAQVQAERILYGVVPEIRVAQYLSSQEWEAFVSEVVGTAALRREEDAADDFDREDFIFRSWSSSKKRRPNTRGNRFQGTAAEPNSPRYSREFQMAVDELLQIPGRQRHIIFDAVSVLRCCASRARAVSKSTGQEVNQRTGISTSSSASSSRPSANRPKSHSDSHTTNKSETRRATHNEGPMDVVEEEPEGYIEGVEEELAGHIEGVEAEPVQNGEAVEEDLVDEVNEPEEEPVGDVPEEELLGDVPEEEPAEYIEGGEEEPEEHIEGKEGQVAGDVEGDEEALVDDMEGLSVGHEAAASSKRSLRAVLGPTGNEEQVGYRRKLPGPVSFTPTDKNAQHKYVRKPPRPRASSEMDSQAANPPSEQRQAGEVSQLHPDQPKKKKRGKKTGREN